MRFHNDPYQIETRAPVMPCAESESTFEVYMRIEPVVLIFGPLPKTAAVEHNNASRLLRDLNRCGLEGIPIRAAFCSEGFLSNPSVAALNCYLRHCQGLSRFRAKNGSVYHRFGWYDFQQLLSLKWQH